MKISVITAVYNREREIASALDAMAAQTWRDSEHLVVDGASTDGTLEIVRNAARPVDRLISEPDRGIYDALNKGIGASSGDVVGFLHSDDVFAHADVLQRIAQAFEDPDVDAVYGDLLYVSQNDPDQVVRRWRSGDFARWKLALGWMPPHPTLFLRRRVYDRIGLFDLGYRISADYDFILRAFSAGLTARRLPDVLVRMRLGGASNAGFRRLILKSSEDWRAASRAGYFAPATIAAKNLAKLPQFVTARLKPRG